MLAYECPQVRKPLYKDMAFKRVTRDGQLLPLKMVKMLTLINEPLGDLNA